MYNRARKLRTIDEVEEYFPGFKAFMDSAEQEIPRPKNKRKKKSYYSGKRNKHTVKTQYMVNSKPKNARLLTNLGEVRPSNVVRFHRNARLLTNLGEVSAA